MGIASVAAGLTGVGSVATLVVVDAAGIAHGETADVALVLGWLTGGCLALVLGLAARTTRTGRAGLGLGAAAIAGGLVAVAVLAAFLA